MDSTIGRDALRDGINRRDRFLEQAHAGLALSQRNHERAKELFERSLISTRERDEAAARVDDLRAELLERRDRGVVVDGDVAADISLLEKRDRFIAVMQGGVVKAGQLLAPAA